jgi:hypothetical protein
MRTLNTAALDSVLSRVEEKQSVIGLRQKLSLAHGEIARLLKLLDATRAQHDMDKARRAVWWFLLGALFAWCLAGMLGGIA